MLYKEDYGNDIACVCDSEHEDETYYVGNMPGKKIYNTVYFRWTDGLFYKRELLTGEETLVDFLNDMNLSKETAVGFLDDYIAIEKISDNKPSIDLFDLYGYDGTKIEADYQKQADDYIYKLIYTNLRDLDLYMKKYIEAKGERFPVRMNYLTERLTLSVIEKLFLYLKDHQVIGEAMSNNFEKCLRLVKESEVEDSVKAIFNIIEALRECGVPMDYSVFQDTFILSAFFKAFEGMEKTEIAQLISDYEALVTAVSKQIDKRCF